MDIFHLFYHFFLNLTLPALCVGGQEQKNKPPSTRLFFPPENYLWWIFFLALVLALENSFHGQNGKAIFWLLFPRNSFQSLDCFLHMGFFISQYSKTIMVALVEELDCMTGRCSVKRVPFFCLFAFQSRTAHGGSQVRGWSKAASAGLCHSHSNAGPKPYLQPTP